MAGHIARVRLALFGAAAACAAAIVGPARASGDYAVSTILTSMPMSRVTQGRLMCASGIRGETAGTLDKAFGDGAALTVSRECVAYLVRFARLGQFGGPPGLKGNRAPITLAFDGSFMTGYQNHAGGEPLSPQLPALAVLLGVAERCLRGQESNGRLCAATGYAIGARMAAGESLT